jgi:hypothetical protein
MDESRKMAFEFSSNVATQLITISTAVITLTIAFAKDVFKDKSMCAKSILLGSWIIYLISICAGVMTLMTLTGALEPKDKNGPIAASGFAESLPLKDAKTIGVADPVDNQPSIWKSNIRLAASTQVITFLFATFLTVVYGATALYVNKTVIHRPLT